MLCSLQVAALAARGGVSLCTNTQTEAGQLKPNNLHQSYLLLLLLCSATAKCNELAPFLIERRRERRFLGQSNSEL